MIIDHLYTSNKLNSPGCQSAERLLSYHIVRLSLRGNEREGQDQPSLSSRYALPDKGQANQGYDDARDGLDRAPHPIVD